MRRWAIVVNTSKASIKITFWQQNLAPDEQQNNQKSEPKKEEPKQKEYDPKIAAEQLKQINALASEYAELATTEVAKIYDALQSKFKYEGSISSLSEENKNVVIKQLETWIKKTKEKSGN